ncbi:MAG TPA: hypothetical protein VFQ85_15570 [Mycobacteriales bacterium]|nr:hypothetical protein [Mycobacteriales bacterium]
MTAQWGDPDPDRTWRPGVEPPPPPPPAPGPPGPGSAAPPPYDYYGAVSAQWWTEPGPPPTWGERLRAWRAPVTTGAMTAAVVVLLGAPVAFLWRWLAPTAVILHTASGPQPAAPESNQVFATDGWFALVTLGVGVVVGVGAFLALRRRGPAVPVGLAAGGLLAALVTAAVGRRLVVDRLLYDYCRRPDLHCFVYDGTLRLHALAAVVVWPVAALMTFALLTTFDRKDV